MVWEGIHLSQFVLLHFLRIKFIVYENNLIVGKANRYLLPFTEKFLSLTKNLRAYLKNIINKVVEVGNIVREEIINANLNDQEKKLDNLNILVLGGSQAAKIFAEELPPIFKKLKNMNINFKIYQQCQKEQSKLLIKFYENCNIEHEIFNFTDKILDYYSKPI